MLKTNEANKLITIFFILILSFFYQGFLFVNMKRRISFEKYVSRHANEWQHIIYTTVVE